MNKPDSADRREADRRMIEMARMLSRIQLLERELESLRNYIFRGVVTEDVKGNK